MVVGYLVEDEGKQGNLSKAVTIEKKIQTERKINSLYTRRTYTLLEVMANLAYTSPSELERTRALQASG